MKNVIFFHLESLNNLFYRMHPECFPNLRRLSSEGFSFCNYYSTATSTLMVITDLFFQNTNQFEESTHLEDIYSVEPSQESLADFLKSFGYELHYFALGKEIDFGSCSGEEFVKILSKFFIYHYYAEAKYIYDGIDKIASKTSPFFLYIEDDQSHISELTSLDCIVDCSSYDLYKYRFKKLDETIGIMIDSLKNNGIYDNTVIVLYGDHGDELYWHNIYEGYTHAIEPYSSMIYCPLVIYGSPVNLQDKTMSLLSTTSLGGLLLYSLGLSNDFSTSPYVFSRNLFAKQSLNLDKFNKSYSVTDGKYLLIVSKKGLEMYMNTIDYASKCNVLNFFTLEKGEISFNRVFDTLVSTHFKFFMTKRTIDEICDIYSVLKLKLHEYLINLYDSTLGGMNFSKINYTNDTKKKIASLQRRFCKNTIRNSIKRILIKVGIYE